MFAFTTLFNKKNRLQLLCCQEAKLAHIYFIRINYLQFYCRCNFYLLEYMTPDYHQLLLKCRLWFLSNPCIIVRNKTQCQSKLIVFIVFIPYGSKNLRKPLTNVCFVIECMCKHIKLANVLRFNTIGLVKLKCRLQDLALPK